MVDKLKHPAKKLWISKFITSAWLTGTMLLFLLKPAMSSNEQLKVQLLNALNKGPTPVAWNIPERDNTEIDQAVSLNTAQNGIDVYDQIKGYVDTQDMDYFNQLRKHQEVKEDKEQIKCKAVIYAISQDALLTDDQRKVLILSQFEILVRMPGSDYRFSKKSGAWLKDHPNDSVYKERVQRYLAYKSYLTWLELDEEWKKLDEELELLEWLLNAFKALDK